MKKNLVLRIYNALILRKLLCMCAVLLFVLSNEKIVAQCGSTINTFPYTEDFEASAAWTMGGTNSTWAWGTPSHAVISSAGGGSKCWCSGGLTGASYAGAQQSWIMSPCFDFTNLSYPWISFKIFWECENIWDGMVMQYSINNGTSWVNVGAFADPVNCLNANWFNYNSISNITSANPRNGWCGRIGATSGSCAGGNGSATWVTAKHCMSALANAPSVKFRFLFGSGTTCNAYDGIAVDDILIQDAPPNQANFTSLCQGGTAVSFTNQSAQCPTTYAWNFGDAASGTANTSALQNPSHTFSAPGSYMVSLTASGPCNAPSTTVIPISVISLSVAASNISCNGGGNGSSTVTVNGGAPAFSYTWLPAGGNASVAAGLSAGTYTVFVKDGNNCTTNRTAIINQPAAMSVPFYTTASCAGGNNGSVRVVPAGGAVPYAYVWNPGTSNTATLSGIGMGTYSVTVTDANSCSVTASVFLNQPATSINGSILSNTPTCGAANGGAGATIYGGIPNYSYFWSPSGGSQAIASNLAGGNYSVTVTDQNNCSVTLSVAIAPSLPVGINVNVTNTSCDNLTDGTASGFAYGGIAPYTYNWTPSSVNGQGTTNVTGLAAGNYSVEVKDVNNCSFTAPFSITAPLALYMNYTTNSVSCNGGNNGNISLTPHGGSPAYSFSCSAFGSIGSSVNSLIAGIYTITLTDSHSCKIDSVISIAEPPVLSASISHTDVLCFGDLTGGTQAMVNGGVPGYTYIWAPTGGNLSSAANLAAGVYSLIAQDANNCSLITVVTLTQPVVPLFASVAITTITCSGGSNGSATVTPGGGTAGYTFLWSDAGGTANSAGSFTTGNRSVHITDQHNCVLTMPFFVPEPPPLVVTATAPQFCSGLPGTITATSNGTAFPLTYKFDGVSTPDNTISVTVNATTVYTVSVTDAKGCVSADATVIITLPPPLTINANPRFSICQGQNSVLTTTASGGQGAYTFMWQPGGMSGQTQTITGTPADAYTVTVKDDCQATQSTTVAVSYFPVPSSQISMNGNNGCAPVCISFSNDSLLRSGLVQTYYWNLGDTIISDNKSPVHCYNKPGRHFIQLTYLTVNGCYGVKMSNDVVRIDPQPVASFTTTTTQFNAYSPTADFKNESLGATSYNWYFNNEDVSKEESPSHTFLNVGDQMVVLIAGNEFGCTDTMVKSINIKPEFTFYAPNSFSPNNDALNDEFRPLGMGWNESKYQLTVYDRWGVKIFDTKNTTTGWDGHVWGSSDVVQNGVYYWKVFLYDAFSIYHEYVGYVLLEK